MDGRHIALLVEDEPEMAAELGELLGSLGHGHIHAATQEKAQQIIERGDDFCYVLLDLQIKVNADSIKARVEAGQNLLVLIRDHSPQRNDADKHCLPVLVMSGHAKDTPSVVKALQDGADDFIVKPLSENKQPFGDKIREALRKSGREKHEHCAGIMSEARSVGGSVGSVASAAGIGRLAITGRQVGRRMEITIGDKAILLTTGSFLTLLSLVAGRLRGGEGWVHKNDLGAKAEQGWKGMSRLRDETGPHLPPNTEITENDKNGSYRLHPSMAIDAIDSAQAASWGDARLRKISAEISRLQKSGSARRS